MGILCQNTFSVNVQPIVHATSFESLEVCITAESFVIRMIVIYRIPPNSKHGVQKSAFISEFYDLIERLSIQSGKLLIVGNFNVHWDK